MAETGVAQHGAAQFVIGQDEQPGGRTEDRPALAQRVITRIGIIQKTGIRGIKTQEVRRTRGGRSGAPGLINEIGHRASSIRSAYGE
ncbi:hypothetical protein AB0L44_25745 [Nonomuraea wenchangensis]|uniref:hypothetical protein n=1 Tax=Nonomuraea wenchangensis TaxID=568860 RepID=UPI003432EDEF